MIQQYPKAIFVFVILLFCQSLAAQKSRKSKLIFSDEFIKLDTTLWKAEIAPSPGSKVYVQNGQLFLDTKGGVTVWLNKKLKGNIRIEYWRRVLKDTGANDRLSDFNTFWMAVDPKNKNLFTRKGVLESYDSLRMYYVGMGGNTNSTTRFRKYEGNGERTLLKEYKDSSHLLKANKEYHVVIELIDDNVRYIVDGEIFFEYNDPSVLKEGYFGFRSTKSRQSVERIKIYQLEK
jgi:rhamnogalacturonan endolyase